MGPAAREYRLTNEPGGLGLSCTAAGLFLAGVPLLRKTDAGFVARPPNEIAALVKAAYGEATNPSWLLPSLDVVARALNRRELARAMIAAVLARAPELTWDAAASLAKGERSFDKFNFNPAEPRDSDGRWTTGDAAALTTEAAPTSDSPTHLHSAPFASHARRSLLLPIASSVSDDAADSDDPQDTPSKPTSSDDEYEQKYDDLGPVEFAKQAIQFGDWLGRNGGNLSPDQKTRALAEYAFLQGRMSFWLGYDYTPPEAQLNLHSAALTLYQGAVNGGLVGPRNLPPSMVDVGGALWSADTAPPNVRPATAKPTLELPRPSLESPPQEIEGFGGTIDNSEVGIVWGNRNSVQGDPWEAYADRNLPDVKELPPKATGFDQFNESTGEATDAKTLNTLTVSVIQRPQQILSRLKGYINKLEDYQPIRNTDLDPDLIQSKTIQLAIPQYTSPTQWRYLDLAARYAKEHGVSLVITRIKG